MLAHNGAIHPQDRLGEMLPPEWERQLGGTTDSERYFLHIMSRLAAHGGDMVAAIADTAADIDRRFEPNSLNAILLAPDKLYAVSWYYRSRSRRPSCGSAGYEPAGRDRRVLRPGLPGHRRRGGRRQLRLAAGRLDAAGEPARAGGRPAHAQDRGAAAASSAVVIEFAEPASAGVRSDACWWSCFGLSGSLEHAAHDGFGYRAVWRQERIGQVAGAADDDAARVGELAEALNAVMPAAAAVPDAAEAK